MLQQTCASLSDVFSCNTKTIPWLFFPQIFTQQHLPWEWKTAWQQSRKSSQTYFVWDQISLEALKEKCASTERVDFSLPLSCSVRTRELYDYYILPFILVWLPAITLSYNHSFCVPVLLDGDKTAKEHDRYWLELAYCISVTTIAVAVGDEHLVIEFKLCASCGWCKVYEIQALPLLTLQRLYQEMGMCPFSSARWKHQQKCLQRQSLKLTSKRLVQILDVDKGNGANEDVNAQNDTGRKILSWTALDLHLMRKKNAHKPPRQMPLLLGIVPAHYELFRICVFWYSGTQVKKNDPFTSRILSKIAAV